MPLPEAIYMYKIMKKIYVKSGFKAVILKLTANVQSDNSFLMLKIYPFGVICPFSRMYKIMKEIHIKSEFFSETCSK